jgi:hypothetical protein
VVPEVVRYYAPLDSDKPWLRKAMAERGIPFLELEYCEQPSGQMRTRVEAFLEVLPPPFSWECCSASREARMHGIGPRWTL